MCCVGKLGTSLKKVKTSVDRSLYQQSTPRNAIGGSKLVISPETVSIHRLWQRYFYIARPQIPSTASRLSPIVFFQCIILSESRHSQLSSVFVCTLLKWIDTCLLSLSLRLLEVRKPAISSSPAEECSSSCKKPLQSSHDTAKPLVHCPKVHESGSRLSVSSAERNKEETGGN